MSRLLRRVAEPVVRRLPVHWRRAIRGVRLQYLVRTDQFGFEDSEFLRLSEWLNPGDVAIDVGANFGSFSLQWLNWSGRQGEFFGSSPCRKLFAMLSVAFSARGFANVHPDQSGVLQYQRSRHDDDSGRPTVRRESVSGRDRRERTIIVRSRMRAHRRFAAALVGAQLVKIDAEGHDGEVIVGMWETIQRYRPVICVEHPPANFHPDRFHRLQRQPPSGVSKHRILAGIGPSSTDRRTVSSPSTREIRFSVRTIETTQRTSTQTDLPPRRRGSGHSATTPLGGDGAL